MPGGLVQSSFAVEYHRSVTELRRTIFASFQADSSAANRSQTYLRSLSREGEDWSWRQDLNPRPTDYKSVALPTELRQHNKMLLKLILRFFSSTAYAYPGLPAWQASSDTSWANFWPCQAKLHRSEYWSGKRDSNPQPTAWKAAALPIELFPRILFQYNFS